MKKKRKKIKKITAKIKKVHISKSAVTIAIVFAFIGGIILWIDQMCSSSSFEAIAFAIENGTEGIDFWQTFDMVKQTVLNTLLCLAIAIAVLYILSKIQIIKVYKNNRKKAYSAGRGVQVTVVILLFSAFFLPEVARYVMSYVAYAKASDTYSAFIQENYVAPGSANITFPEQKRNLVYIFLESMETSFMDAESGGVEAKSIIPELTYLAKNNINFSDSENIGGATFEKGTSIFPGVGWTIAGITSQTSGLPLKQVSNEESNSNDLTTILQNASTLGDVLAKNGYNSVFTCGSHSAYAGRDKYFKYHGNAEIKDWISAQDEGFIPEGYNCGFWGMEDAKLVEYVKLQLTELAAQDAPFALTMLTSSTHFPDGYVDETSETKFDSQYKNAVATSSRQIYELIEWMKTQDFYDNTTIVLAGDHLTMADYGKKIKENLPNYNRTTYNCFINSAVQTKYNKNREFTNIDMFPTVLRALGADFDGNQLGLGVDLFSGEKTLAERYGFEYITAELLKSSTYYNWLAVKKQLKQ